MSKRKALTAELKAEGRTFTATITTNAIDRDGEVLLPEGMIAADFEKNPIVFWNHDYDRPIGKAVHLEKSKDGWSATAKLADRPDDHQGEWFPDTVHALMKQGIIKGVSVGFQPIEGRNPSKKDIETFGGDLRYVFNKWKLLEYSVAPLPANQDALVSAVSKGLMTADRCKSLFGVEVPDEPKTKRKTFFIVKPPVVINPVTVVKQAVTVAFARRRGKMVVD